MKYTRRGRIRRDSFGDGIRGEIDERERHRQRDGEREREREKKRFGRAERKERYGRLPGEKRL